MGDGVTPSDLAAIRRELFLDALTVARHDHDPASEWEAFCEAAWREAGLAFGFLPRAGITEEGATDHPRGPNAW